MENVETLLISKWKIKRNFVIQTSVFSSINFKFQFPTEMTFYGDLDIRCWSVNKSFSFEPFEAIQHT